ncbi:MAG: hypothetical protein U5O39_17250 [Gammaproteobacteria bacterium]|nr:hypothetical protein [Gammaproteobacteria bacterium]
MSRILLVALLLVAAGCTTLGPEPSERIVGRWSGEVGGYPIVIAYGEDTVTVEGADPVGYSLSENELTFEGGGSRGPARELPVEGRN